MNFKSVLKNKASLIWMIVTAVLLAIIIVANILATTMLSSLFNIVFGRPQAILGGGRAQTYVRDYDTKDEARIAGEEVNLRIVEEGIVLLKNDASALPLDSGAKVSVFGKNSVNLVYGGSGSGGGKHENANTIYESLTEAGFRFNPTLKSFYESSASGSGRSSNPAIEDQGATAALSTGETPQSSYTDAIVSSYDEYSDAALIVISRIGGEGWDLPRSGGHGSNEYAVGDHYLRLDKNERALIEAVCGKGFDEVVVIINSNNALELGDIKADSRISACLWIGTPGDTGIMALGNILNGSVSPSGKTVDTYSRNFENDPVWVNFGDMNKNNGEKYLENGTARAVSPTYVDYEEGIYVGYRYFETRGFVEEQNGNPNWYDENVVYPFGYGMSYSSFTQEFVSKPNNAVFTKNNKLTVEVRVTNNGLKTAKDVVQIYVSADYNPGGIEKAHVVLAGFAKTDDIAAGTSAVVSVELDPYLFASYDSAVSQCFVLEQGNYEVKLGKNAHEMYDSFTASVASKIEYKEGADTDVKNRFADADDELGEMLSRADFAGTMPAARSDVEREISADTKAKLESKATNNPISVPMSQYPEVGKSGTLDFYDMVGEDYGSEKWDEFMDMMTIAEMTKIVTDGQFKTEAIGSLRIPATICADGPFGFTTFMSDSVIYGCNFYASEVVIASTWNQSLAEEFGIAAGNEALVGNERGDGLPYSGWYAPGVNIHRSPFGGRNGEYFSEDSLLSGKMAAAQIKGAKSKGVMTFVKHFAVNEQETSRTGIATWLTEQSLREIYLRPFELAVVEGKTTAMMSSFNRIGTMWTGGDYRLLTEVLRDEWGFRGMVICDYFVNNQIADPKQMIYAGGDLHLMAATANWFSPNNGSATDITILRKAAQNVLYAVANSNITDYDIIGYRLAGWVVAMIIIDIVVVLALAGWGVFVLLRLKKLEQGKS